MIKIGMIRYIGSIEAKVYVGVYPLVFGISLHLIFRELVLFYEILGFVFQKRTGLFANKKKTRYR